MTTFSNFKRFSSEREQTGNEFSSVVSSLCGRFYEIFKIFMGFTEKKNFFLQRDLNFLHPLAHSVEEKCNVHIMFTFLLFLPTHALQGIDIIYVEGVFVSDISSLTSLCKLPVKNVASLIIG